MLARVDKADQAGWRAVSYQPAVCRRCPASRAQDSGPYPKLLGRAQWQQLPAPVRDRFSRTLADGESRIFHGAVTHTAMTRAGWLLAQAARVIGAPLPLHHGGTGPAHVVVTEDKKQGLQFWTRIYAGADGFPQVINSAKRFSGPTGLEECLGAGVLMRLVVLVANGALVFRSAGFALAMFGRPLCLPEWAVPWRCDVIHRDMGNGRFTFTLELHNAWLGMMLRQVAEFTEINTC